jgi:RNA polymerase sigma-70 factor (ECF subfamily)
MEKQILALRRTHTMVSLSPGSDQAMLDLTQRLSPDSDATESTDRADADLVRRMAAGDEAALTLFYGRYAVQVLGFLCTMASDGADAEEVLQDTFVAAWKGASSFRGEAQVRTWLLGIARNRIRDRRRRRGLGADTLTSFDDVRDPADSPEDVALGRVSAAELAGLIGKLSLHQKTILSLAFVQELSYQEMADVLGIPIGTVKSRLNNAKHALAMLLARAAEKS